MKTSTHLIEPRDDPVKRLECIAGPDVGASQKARIERVLLGRGWSVRWHAASGTAPPAPLACLELDGPLAVSREAAIARLVAQGAQVLTWADGSAAWPIGEQCHVIVQGASALLDSSAPDFFEQAADTLCTWHRESEERRAARSVDAELRAQLGIVGSSAALASTWLRLRRAATLADLPVLLMGETGSGKELLARAVHRLDPLRCQGPWIAVNCAAIAPELAEAELFGHERGSFTGAHRDRPGLFRAAQGGVLFLDEVAELAPSLQAKLLRAIQEKRVLPVGAHAEQAVDVRLVAATHRDLAQRVAQGAFREDLFHRLAVLPVDVPPLRQRREDVADLIDHFLLHCTRGGSGQPWRASVALREALMQHALPGNARQLDNLLRQAVVAAGAGPGLDLQHLPATVLCSLEHAAATVAEATSPPVAAKDTAAPDATGPVPAALGELFAAANWNMAGCAQACERALLQAALSRSRGNQAAMARLLGVTPRCIYTKLRRHLLS